MARIKNYTKGIVQTEELQNVNNTLGEAHNIQKPDKKTKVISALISVGTSLAKEIAMEKEQKIADGKLFSLSKKISNAETAEQKIILSGELINEYQSGAKDVPERMRSEYRRTLVRHATNLQKEANNKIIRDKEKKFDAAIEGIEKVFTISPFSSLNKVEDDIRFAFSNQSDAEIKYLTKKAVVAAKKGRFNFALNNKQKQDLNTYLQDKDLVSELSQSEINAAQKIRVSDSDEKINIRRNIRDFAETGDASMLFQVLSDEEENSVKKIAATLQSVASNGGHITVNQIENAQLSDSVRNALIVNREKLNDTIQDDPLVFYNSVYPKLKNSFSVKFNDTGRMTTNSQAVGWATQYLTSSGESKDNLSVQTAKALGVNYPIYFSEVLSVTAKHASDKKIRTLAELEEVDPINLLDRDAIKNFDNNNMSYGGKLEKELIYTYSGARKIIESFGVQSGKTNVIIENIAKIAHIRSVGNDDVSFKDAFDIAANDYIGKHISASSSVASNKTTHIGLNRTPFLLPEKALRGKETQLSNWVDSIRGLKKNYGNNLSEESNAYMKAGYEPVVLRDGALFRVVAQNPEDGELVSLKNKRGEEIINTLYHIIKGNVYTKYGKGD